MLTEDEKYQVAQRLANDDEPDACKAFAKLAGIECEGFACDGCMREAVDAIERRLVPEGMEWPRFEDGEPVRIGDRVQLCSGYSEELCQVHMGESGYSLYTEASDEDHPYGVPVRRPEPEDTQERIDRDARKIPCEYFGREGLMCSGGDGCPSLEMGCSCDTAKTLDLLRRQRELDARKDGAR